MHLPNIASALTACIHNEWKYMIDQTKHYLLAFNWIAISQIKFSEQYLVP